jgi:hypothetical protein
VGNPHKMRKWGDVPTKHQRPFRVPWSSATSFPRPTSRPRRRPQRRCRPRRPRSLPDAATSRYVLCLRRPRERDARDLRRLRQEERKGSRHILCTCPESNGVTRAVDCTKCFGRSVCAHGRRKRQCRDCANGEPLARDKKCPICDKRLDYCKAKQKKEGSSGCKPKPE